MKANTTQTKAKKDHLYKLLETFDEKELKKVRKFAELLNKAKKENDAELLKFLESVQFDAEELSEKTIEEIKRARSDIRKGNFYTLSKIKEEIGI